MDVVNRRSQFTESFAVHDLVRAAGLCNQISAFRRKSFNCQSALFKVGRVMCVAAEGWILENVL